MSLVQDDVLAAVSPNWETARAIHWRIGCWAFASVRHQLRALSASGTIERRDAPHPSGIIMEFRRSVGG